MTKIHSLIFAFLCLCVRGLLRLRYKIEVQGWEKVLSLREFRSGILFLPNHPAEIDPVIVMSILGPSFFPHGLVVEHFYYMRGFQKILEWSRMVPIPNLEEQISGWKKKRLAKILQKIGEEIKRGENYLIYPAGRLKLTRWEKLGGASLVHTLLLDNPTTPVVLVRTTGLWGSSFSRHSKERSPDFAKTLLQGIKILLQGGIFFVPKRTVLVEFEVCQPLTVQKDRLAFNQALESWYNYPKAEEISLVPYSYFFHAKPLLQQKKEEDFKEDESFALSEKIEKEVIFYLASLSKIPLDKITRQSHLAFDLGLDSLNIADIHLFLDKHYDVGFVQLSSLKKVSDVLRVIAHKELTGNRAQKEEKNLSRWEEKRKRKPLSFSTSEVIQEAFLESCDRMGSSIACADVQSGVFSYKEMKRLALILAQEFSKLPGDRVAILLPSSVITYLSIMALFLCGKIPVMLNWTAGRIALDHAKKIGGFHITITSGKFLDKISLEDLGEVEETFLLLEEVKRKLPLRKKLKGYLQGFLPAHLLIKHLKLPCNPSACAVFLFTSGTEAMPKAVPLLHRHIMINQKSAFVVAKLQSTDSLCGALPPFHSFGFSLTGLFPLLCGLKVLYIPDPTDGYAMASEIDKRRLTVLCLAPSFIQSIFSAAKERQLQTLRLIVSGAEKPAPALLAFVEKYLPNATWIEGYGITECSPIVSLQPPEKKPSKGVGELLSGIEVCTIDPDSLSPLLKYVEGEICIRGPSVFEGYADDSKDPFIEIEGKKWYRTGDLGRIDEEKNLYLTGRLKRTIKIGGEMISLEGIEQELLHAAKEKIWYTSSQTGPSLATLAFTIKDKTQIVLCSTFVISVEEVNLALRERGMGRIVKIAKVVILPEIPLMGTGKIHYRMLEEKIRGMHVI